MKHEAEASGRLPITMHYPIGAAVALVAPNEERSVSEGRSWLITDYCTLCDNGETMRVALDSLCGQVGIISFETS
eukprot:COSAG04_NODE_11032_length_735_cov_0.863208_1_plen_75_part_00